MLLAGSPALADGQRHRLGFRRAPRHRRLRPCGQRRHAQERPGVAGARLRVRPAGVRERRLYTVAGFDNDATYGSRRDECCSHAAAFGAAHPFSGTVSVTSRYRTAIGTLTFASTATGGTVTGAGIGSAGFRVGQQVAIGGVVRRPHDHRDRRATRSPSPAARSRPARPRAPSRSSASAATRSRSPARPSRPASTSTRDAQAQRRRLVDRRRLQPTSS